MPENAANLEGDQPLLRTAGLVVVMNTPKGRGVFATKEISRGTIVEISPVLIFTEDEVEKHTRHTTLQHYTYPYSTHQRVAYFEPESFWPSESGRSMTQALALGLGSMFNHSTHDQNVGWLRNTETDVIIYTALRDIKAGEELCISYGSARLWFPDADAQANSTNGAENDDVGGQTLAELDMSGLSRMAL
ncbi:hypothetical protein H2200_003658 [Cladophialophora chaetospira]|uniref:SET domain-containing protein n=1 Tax=Cladophialophora chaetospira TaxID=386627 RepID=A0AA39CLA9_9EURO|nr:hypothetical protein H2200_003658 [Cladophialophora chaetospira]